MADTVTTTTLFNGRKRKVYQFTNVSDGSGESAVVKVDISTLTFYDGVQVPTYTVVDMLDFNVQGFASVRLYWDHTTDDTIAILPAGVGTVYYQAIGGNVDPRSAGGSGDLLISTNGGASGSTYTIIVYLRPKN